HPNPTVKAQRLAYLIFERPDLDTAERFLSDFGLVVSQRNDDTLYLRGTGPAAYCYRVHRGEKARFVGFGLALAAHADLQKLARLPG
ncbi:hypothetical protein ACMWP8_28370, partial [Escherichia coli]|uniref:hypothetical protein n=1 Tax=Escherichia coli TaxID=562 RepID=UPI0039E03725